MKPELCHKKFELKVNDVRFVGHPTLLPFRANKDDGTSSTILINIVFALQALASHSVGAFINFVYIDVLSAFLYNVSYLQSNVITI